MSKCKNCQIESKGDKPRLFCSDKCRVAYNRDLIKQPNKVNEQKQTNTPEKKETDNKIKEMDAEMLYACIFIYENDDWKDSPEYGELLERLKNPVDWLRERGYFIPSFKYA